MKKVTLVDFIKNSNIDSDLIKAVVKQSGGWEDFQQTAIDVTNYGAESGFSGWDNDTETCDFYQNNRDKILDLAASVSSDLGQDMLDMISQLMSFIENDISIDEIEDAIYHDKGELTDIIQNTMAWFALEVVSKAYEHFSNS